MLRTLFVFAIIGPSLFLAVFNTFAALLLYPWFALFYPQDWVSFDISGLHLSLLIGALVVIPSLLKREFPNLTHRLSIGMVLFFGVALIAQLNAPDPATGRRWLDYMARLLVICLIAVRLVDTSRRFHLVMLALGVSYGIHSASRGLTASLAGDRDFWTA